MMHRLIPLGILLMLSSKWIFPAVFNAQFSDSYVYFNIYLLLLIPRLIFPQSVLIAGGQTRVQLYISIAEFVVNITEQLVADAGHGTCRYCIRNGDRLRTGETLYGILPATPGHPTRQLHTAQLVDALFLPVVKVYF